jgi:5'-nucleotidase
MRKQILVSNDDGITAKGIRALIEVAATLGDVLVVAPDKPQSGQGHAITLEQPLRLYEVDLFGDIPNVRAYECSGTPVDCVKLAKNVIGKGQKFDLCVSGINHGANTSINIIYSGTMSAATEAAVEKIPAVGFSLTSFKHDADFSAAKHYVQHIMQNILEKGLSETNLLNVNIPNLPLEQLKGLRVCRQAKGHWTEEFLEGKDPSGRPYFWLAGRFICEDEGEDTDIWAIENGFVSIVPAMFDLTHYPALQATKQLFN